MPDHLDLCRNDIQLLGGDRSDLGQGITIMSANQLGFGDLVNDSYPGKVLRERPCLPEKPLLSYAEVSSQEKAVHRQRVLLVEDNPEAGLTNTLIVAVTGYGQERDRRRAEESGFDRYLIKPLDSQAIMDLLACLPAKD
jgi:hypothetical protein